MSEAKGEAGALPKKGRGCGVVVLALVLLVGLASGVVWHWHGVWVARAVEGGLRAGLPFLGFSLVNLEVEVQIGRSLILRKVELGPPSGAPEANSTQLRIEEIELTPAGIWEVISGKSRWVNRVSWRGVEGVLDYRSANFPPPLPLAALTPEQEKTLFPWVLRILPLALEGKVDRLEVLADGQAYRVDELELSVREGRVGQVRLGKAELNWPGGGKVITNKEGRSIWRDGSLYLLGLPLEGGLELSEFELTILRPGGPGLRAEFAAFAGWVRVDAAFPIQDTKQALELSAWARAVDLAAAAAWAGSREEVQGKIREARLSYRGLPEALQAGTAVGTIQAEGVAWADRKFDSLVVGARLGEGKLELSEFSLLQGANQIMAHGEVKVPSSGDWLRAEVSGELQADLPDLAALSALAGTDLTQAAGSLRIKAEATVKAGEPAARVKVSGESLQWRGVGLGDLGAEVRLDAREAEVIQGWIRGPALRGEATGTVQLQGPHLYAGALQLTIENLAMVSDLVPMEGFPEPMHGKLELQWRGDGTKESHSGAFGLQLADFKFGAMPVAVAGRFSGTYSPESWYIGEAVLRQRDWELSGRLFAGRSGLHADDILLQAKQEKLLAGEVYLPWNPLSLLQEGGWPSGVLAEKPIYASIESAELSIERLGLLLGQDWPIQGRGRISLSAGGVLSEPKIEAKMLWRDLRSADAERREWVRRLEVAISSEAGRMVCRGEAVLPLVRPITWEVQTPFGFRVKENEVEWIEPTGALSGEVLWPATPIGALGPVLPPFHKLAGSIGAEIKLGGTLFTPQIDGTLRLQDGVLQINRQAPRLDNLSLTCRFDGDSFRLENTGGNIGAGPFEVRGGGSFADLANPRVDLRVVGDNLLLLRDRQMRLRTDVDITAEGTMTNGRLSGRIGLVDGRIFQRLEITPLLQAAGSEAQPMPLLPEMAGLVPPPFGDWRLDLVVENDTPFLLIGNLASGEIIPEIRLGGTLAAPLPSGQVKLRDLYAYLPFSVVHIPEGFIYLDPLNPRIPIMDVRGYSQVLEYQITLLSQGPLDEGNLYLRSDPPLSQEAIILLLTAGLAPGMQAGSSFGEAAIGQGGLLLLKTMARQFDTTGVDTDSLLNRLQITSQPGLTPGMRATMRGEFRLTDNFGIMAQRDGLGFLGAGLTYSIRFR